jgi:hypothetical protein
MNFLSEKSRKGRIAHRDMSQLLRVNFGIVSGSVERFLHWSDNLAGVTSLQAKKTKLRF